MREFTNGYSNAVGGADTDPWIEGLFTVESILPVQFNEHRKVRSGEERLLIAVLHDAVNCFLGDDAQAAAEASSWFTTRRGIGPFAFQNICDILAVESDELRRRLFKQRAALRNRASSSITSMPLSRAA